MARGKVKLELITNVSARKVTFRKRMKGLMKKVDELTTLCGVDACIIVYSPYLEAQPAVWPNTAGVHKVLKRFKTLPSEVQSRRMLDQKTFMEEKVKKAVQQLEKLRKENHETAMNLLMNDFLYGRMSSFDELDVDLVHDLCEYMDEKIMLITQIIEKRKMKMKIKREDFSDNDSA